MDPVTLLVNAIATQEGWFDGPKTIPVERNNPGDLRFAHQLNATRPDGSTAGHLTVEPIAVFTKPATGIVGAFRDVWEKVALGLTVRQIISTWAPPNENDTSGYLQNILTWTKLPADTPVLDLLPPLVNMRNVLTWEPAKVFLH